MYGNAKKPEYRMYVDESGNSSLKPNLDQNERFLCLSGVILNLEYEKKIVTPALEELKTKYFQNSHSKKIIFHRKEIQKAKGHFSTLLDADIKSRFDNDLLNFLTETDYTLISVCIDKKRHLDTYKSFAYNAYEYSMRVLSEKYIYFLKRENTTGDILAESRGKPEDKGLKESYKHMILTGTEYLSPMVVQNSLSSIELKMSKKDKNLTGLQIADILVHDSRKQILSEQNHTHGKITDFSKKLFSIMNDKYDKNNGYTYGKKML